MAFMKEFREFAIKGSVVDLAVGVIIGAPGLPPEEIALLREIRDALSKR